jgi:PBP1b-binding outer membrane lipoprotein LpoB
MRKLFVIAAIIAAPMFITSCGSGKQSEEVVVDSTAVDSVQVEVDTTKLDSMAVM